MVFQKPNPFPKSIYENVAYGPRIHGLATGKSDMDQIVEQSLRALAVDRQFEAMAALGVGLKDIGLALDEADRLGVSVRAGRMTTKLWREAIDRLEADTGAGHLYKLLEDFGLERKKGS